MRLVCRKNGAESKVFTDGKVYEAWQEPGREYTRVWAVQDDVGHVRYVIPGELCPHLVRQVHRAGSLPTQVCVGRFEICQ